MGLGVLQDRHLGHVPGTVVLNEEAAHSEIATQTLKHGTGSNSHIILSPQPSDDPNDPLNWPLWRRDMIYAILNFACILCAGVNGPLMNAIYVVVAKDYNKTITQVVVVSGYNLLVTGASGPLYCAWSRIYGKRSVFLVSVGCYVVGTAIGEASRNYSMLLAARIIQGLGQSAFESILAATINDIYYVHERGIRASVATLMTLGVSNLATIITGQIAQNLGWHWVFHLLQIFTALVFVLIFFFCPETTYNRRDIEVDIVADGDPEEEGKGGTGELKQCHVEVIGAGRTATRTSIPAKKTYIQSLAIFTGRYSDENPIKLIIAPFVVLLNPGALYAVLLSSILNTFYTTVAILQSGMFSGPPWHFGPGNIGNLSAGPFVGALLASIFFALTSDWFAKRLAVLNRGVYEPEFRLVLMPLCLVLCTIGMFLYGHVVQQGYSAVICATVQGVMQAGIVLAFNTSYTYGLDGYRDQTNEFFIINMVMKNFLAYGFSNFVNDWVVAVGAMEVMSICGAITVFLILLAVPVWIFGKRLRSFWARHNLLIKFGMQPMGEPLVPLL